jgi:hypothetical protein
MKFEIDKQNGTNQREARKLENQFCFGTAALAIQVE